MSRFIAPSLLLLVACSTDPGTGDGAPATLEGDAAHEVVPGPPEAGSDRAESFRFEPSQFVDLPEGPEGEAIRRGRELIVDTHRLLPDHVGNGLNCTNCHLQAGTVPKAAPFVGVTDRYPRYRKRSGKVDDLQDRINGCMERSMNGRALERDSEPLRAMIAYMTWLSRDVPDGKKVEGIGMPRIERPGEPDPERGRALFEERCASCHGKDGQGVFGPDDKTIFPPLWGERSYNIGAGMARLNTAAAFIKWNMPLNQGGTLTDQEAYDIASYFIFQERPDFAKKDGDWPKGGKPEDARY